MEIAYPEKRRELLGILEELSIKDLQKAYWIDGVDDPFVHGIDEVYHFFFDDNDFGKDPKKEIGRILKNEQEASVIWPLVQHLDWLLEDVGDADSAVFMQHAEWPKLMELADAALSKLKTDGSSESPS